MYCNKYEIIISSDIFTLHRSRGLLVVKHSIDFSLLCSSSSDKEDLGKGCYIFRVLQ